MKKCQHGVEWHRWPGVTPPSDGSYIVALSSGMVTGGLWQKWLGWIVTDAGTVTGWTWMPKYPKWRDEKGDG
jgi:hypothetical protein